MRCAKWNMQSVFIAFMPFMSLKWPMTKVIRMGEWLGLLKACHLPPQGFHVSQRCLGEGWWEYGWSWIVSDSMNSHKCMQKNNLSSIPRRSNNDLVLGRDLLIWSFWIIILSSAEWHWQSLCSLANSQPSHLVSAGAPSKNSTLPHHFGEFCMHTEANHVCHIQPQIPPKIGSLEQPNYQLVLLQRRCVDDRKLNA